MKTNFIIFTLLSCVGICSFAGTGEVDSATYRKIPASCSYLDSLCESVSRALNASEDDLACRMDGICGSIKNALNPRVGNVECSDDEVCTGVRTALLFNEEDVNCRTNSLCVGVRAALTKSANDLECRTNPTCVSYSSAGFTAKNLKSRNIRVKK